MIEIIVCLVVGYIIGNAHTIWRLRKLIAEAGIDFEKNLAEADQPKVHIHKLTVETMDDILYLYDRDTNDFVCQAKSLEELAKSCKEYKNIMVATVIHDSKVFIFANGKSQEFKG